MLARDKRLRKEDNFKVMRDDEFNSKRPINESRQKSREFGKTQKDEFSFSHDPLKAHTYQSNDPKIKNDSVKENTGLKEKPKVIKTNSTEIAKTSSLVHSVTVAATVVSVTTISVIAGVGIVKQNRSSANFLSFEATEHEFFYVLRINSEDEKALFYIDVSNKDYENRQELRVGENEGVFEGLTPGKAYTVTVKEDGFAGATLYNETFYARSEEIPFSEESIEESSYEDSSEYSEPIQEPTWYGLTFDRKASFKDKTFEVALNYFDEENYYKDFVFTLYEPENDGVSYGFPLEKTTATQTIDVETADCFFDIIHGSFRYDLTAVVNGERISLEEELEPFNFTDTSGAKSEVYSITFSEEANYLEGTFQVTLDYVDELDEFDSFFLHLEEPTGASTDLYLIHQTETQTVTIESFSDFRLSDVEYDYQLIVYTGEDSNTLLSGKVSFIDSARGYISYFNFPKTANFDDSTFEIEIKFEDPNDRISNVRFNLTQIDGNQNSLTFNVEKMDGIQVFEAPVEPIDEGVDLITGNFTYSLVYDYDGVETTYESGEVSFENSLESHFDEFRCDFAFSANDNFLPIYMDYVNDARYFEMVEMHLTYGDPATSDGEIDHMFYFELVQGAQLYDFTYDFNGNELNLNMMMESTVHATATVEIYNPKFDTSSVQTLLDEDVSITRQQMSEVFGLGIISTEVNSELPDLPVQPYYVDDYGRFSNMQLGVTTNSGKTYYYTFSSSVNFRTDYESIPLSEPLNEVVEIATLVEELRSPIDLLIRYEDSGEVKEVLCHTGVQLEVV